MADNEFMSLIVIIIFGIIMIYVGLQIENFGYAFIAGGIVAFILAIVAGWRLVS